PGPEPASTQHRPPCTTASASPPPKHQPSLKPGTTASNSSGSGGTQASPERKSLPGSSPDSHPTTPVTPATPARPPNTPPCSERSAARAPRNHPKKGTDMTAMISATDLRKTYGKKRALDGFTLSVDEGTVCGLLGPNGAGKTTAVRILATLLKADSGNASIAGHDLTTDAGRVRAAIGFTGQFSAVDEILTGRQNLDMFARLYHLDRRQARQRTDELLDRFALHDAADRPAGGYSGGMRRRLDLAVSLVLAPRVRFLDEPSSQMGGTRLVTSESTEFALAG